MQPATCSLPMTLQPDLSPSRCFYIPNHDPQCTKTIYHKGICLSIDVRVSGDRHIACAKNVKRFPRQAHCPCLDYTTLIVIINKRILHITPSYPSIKSAV